MSLLAVYRRNAETRDPRAQHVVRVLSSGYIFHLEEERETFEYRSDSNCCVLSIYPISDWSPEDHPNTSGARRQDVGSFVTNIDT